MPTRPPWRIAGSLAIAAFAVLTLASSLTPNDAWRERALEGIVPDGAQAVAHALGVVGGVVLLVLARGLWRGRRRAGPVAVAEVDGARDRVLTNFAEMMRRARAGEEIPLTDRARYRWDAAKGLD